MPCDARWSEEQIRRFREWIDAGVKGFNGTGPFCWERWEPRNELVLVKHEAYDWGPPFYERSSPAVDRLVWKIVPEESTTAFVPPEKVAVLKS